MNYNSNFNDNQSNFLFIPCTLENFCNTNTECIHANDKDIIVFEGYIKISDNDKKCPICGNKMCYNDKYEVKLKHIPFGSNYTYLKVEKAQFICYDCNITKTQDIPFKCDNHNITLQAKKYIEDLLSTGNFTNKDISYLTGINRNIVKDIDKERLIKKYTIDGKGKELIKPEVQAKYLGIDEFKLHDGYKYATHIINLETGNILWIAEGKKKQVVYDFINHVGDEWISNVEAVACDMNSDFEEAFREKCPNIKIVYDYFHIVKNFNEKVITPIRIEEQKRLENEGDKEAARRLKRSKYILMSSVDTLKKKDDEATEKKVLSNGSSLFNTPKIIRKGCYYDRYETLINNNELFLIIELIKELLEEAFKTDNEQKMISLLFDIMELCEANGNKHLLWFLNLIYKHFDGIITHATYKISSGKIEGINNKIKTLRRQAYGYPDDEYFFLKLFDMSRN